MLLQKSDYFPFKYALVYVPKFRASCCKPHPLQSGTGLSTMDWKYDLLQHCLKL